ncbi:MAG: hypothetical protein Q7N50_03820 [Armatimonadota bacterium]|nr:hypothetical protein [Armatimonadota bacterium]
MEQKYELPINIERLREQWKEEGLYPSDEYRPPNPAVGEKVFDEEPIEVAAVFDNDSYGDPSRPATPNAAIEAMQEEIQAMRETFARELQDTKDSYLLELRSLKGLTLDLASLVYEVTEDIREEKSKKPWYKLRRK